MRIPFLFLAVVLLLSWVLFLIPVSVFAVTGSQMPGEDVFRFAGTFVPTLAGLLCTGKFRGRGHLRSLLLSTVRFRFRPGWFALVFLFMPVVVLAAAVVTKIAGAPLPPLQFLDPPYGIVLAFFYIFLLQGPLGEEFGWRGFALPGLLGGMRPLWAGLIVGIFWSVWHLPLFFFSGSTQSMIPFAGYAVFTTVMSLVYTVVWIKTAGAMFYPLVLHTTSNLAHGILMLIGTPEGQKTFFLVFLVVSAGFLAGFWKLLLKPPRSNDGGTLYVS